MSIASPVLERHLSAQAIVSAKQNLATLTAHIAELLHARIPAISLDDCAWLARAASTWVAGIWPAVNPPPAVVEALSRPELAAMQPAFERDFTRLLSVLVKGLLPPAVTPPRSASLSHWAKPFQSTAIRNVRSTSVISARQSSNGRTDSAATFGSARSYRATFASSFNRDG